MKKYFIALLLFVVTIFSFAQNKKENQKVILTTYLDEIVLTARKKLNPYNQQKILSSIDDYLESSSRVNMIKRGNYAWEPTLNNMSSERLNITIDGMQIFGACTDKMDPITSYIDVSNLEKVEIKSGQEGTEHSHNVGGSINLKLPKSDFKNNGIKATIDAGYEFNGNYKTTGGSLDINQKNTSLKVNALYRKADSYKAGNNKEVKYSQFEKYNLAIDAGFKLSETNLLRGTLIYDKATDIGYPALPMDVSLAKATIASLSHIYNTPESILKSVESKIYFNTITHVMDDSKRPDVPVRMDMPGWSDTFGMYSKGVFNFKNHIITANINSYYNKSLAEMTMYPNNPDENTMFMYTWPDIRTWYSGLFIKDEFEVNPKNHILISGRIGFHYNEIAKKEGIESLQIFYPRLSKTKNRILTSLTANYTLQRESQTLRFGIGYGQRAPSVSEGYGFFIFNSFDNYDYIGNPDLKEEQSLETSLAFNKALKKLTIGVEGAFFHVKNYIIGNIDSSISPMTIGANGVRLYQNIPHANLVTVSATSRYSISSKINIENNVSYGYGRDHKNNPLPLISPFQYAVALNYASTKFNATVNLTGNTLQNNYAAAYGEDKTASFAIVNISFGNKIKLYNNLMIVKYGVENVLDSYYSTYSDWNNIPRKGRNVYINVSYKIN